MQDAAQWCWQRLCSACAAVVLAACVSWFGSCCVQHKRAACHRLGQQHQIVWSSWQCTYMHCWKQERPGPNILSGVVWGCCGQANHIQLACMWFRRWEVDSFVVDFLQFIPPSKYYHFLRSPLQVCASAHVCMCELAVEATCSCTPDEPCRFNCLRRRQKGWTVGGQLCAFCVPQPTMQQGSVC